MNKLKSRKGATILLALVFLLLCALSGTLLLMLAQNFGRHSLKNREEDAKELAVMSAADVLKEQLNQTSGVWNVEELDELEEGTVCREILKEVTCLCRNYMIDPDAGRRESMIVFSVDDSSADWTIPDVYAQMSVSPDEGDFAEFLDEEHKVISIPFHIRVVYYTGEDGERERHMSLHTVGTVVYDKEALTVDVALDESVMREE